MLLSKVTYSAFRLYIFNQYVCSLGIEPTTFCAADAMLYHWATGTYILYFLYYIFIYFIYVLRNESNALKIKDASSYFFFLAENV